MARRATSHSTNAEGGITHASRKDELKDLRGTQKALQRDLLRAKEKVKEIKAELVQVEDKIGSTIDDIDQPLLPFDLSGNGATGAGADEETL